MSKLNPRQVIFSVVISSALSVAFEGVANAQRRSPLADAPAVRNRVELRAKRAELGAGIATTLGQDFYHGVLLNLRAGFHFSDAVGLAAVVGLNVNPAFKTGFNERLTGKKGCSGSDCGALPEGGPMGTDKAPDRATALSSMNDIGYVAGLQLEVAPFSGKFAMFSKLFMNYDFYLFAGPGIINLKIPSNLTPANACAAAADNNAAVSCSFTGNKIGANFGIGVHAYINDFMALNVELRDILIRNNPSGRDVTGDKLANNDDLTWDSNYMVTLGVVINLPTAADITP